MSELHQIQLSNILPFNQHHNIMKKEGFKFVYGFLAANQNESTNQGLVKYDR